MNRRDFLGRSLVIGGPLAMLGMLKGCAQEGAGVAAAGHARFDVVARDATVPIADGVPMQAWTFNGTVPGPVLRMRQGDTAEVNFSNQGHMGHSLDLHAAHVDPAQAFRDIDPGQAVSYRFRARWPGAFLYHCGTRPVMLHIGAGMYGALIVDPREPLPPAREFVLVYSEFYLRKQGQSYLPDFEAMREDQPGYAAFDGRAFRYRDAPLKVRRGERVRFYVVNAGPRGSCAFHVIGMVFDKVYPGAPPDGAIAGVSTHSVPPGGGAVFELQADVAGTFPFVNHDVGHGDLGAFGLLVVEERHA